MYSENNADQQHEPAAHIPFNHDIEEIGKDEDKSDPEKRFGLETFFVFGFSILQQSEDHPDDHKQHKSDQK